MAGNIHVIKKDDVWQVKSEGSKKAIKNFETQKKQLILQYQLLKEITLKMSFMGEMARYVIKTLMETIHFHLEIKSSK